MQQPGVLVGAAGLRAQARQVNSDTAGVLVSTLRAAGARQVLDLGCGDGSVTALLAEAGFEMTGLDPSPEALRKAAARLPGVRFVEGRAEALPPGLGPFDAACFVNALHHVRSEAMPAALLGAFTALRPGGVLLVIEPLAQGSFFRAMRPVEDETRIRAEAAAAIEALISAGRIVLRDLRRWNRESGFADLEDFVAHLARVDPERAELARRNGPALARAWRDNIVSRDGRAVLVQPLIGWTLALP